MTSSSFHARNRFTGQNALVAPPDALLAPPFMLVVFPPIAFSLPERVICAES